METGNALRETSDALLRDLDVLVAIEEEKRTLEPGDPRLVELAERIEEIARRVLDSTNRQHQLTRAVNAQVDRGSPDAPETTIDETPRPIQAVLADWREAERRAAPPRPARPKRPRPRPSSTGCGASTAAPTRPPRATADRAPTDRPSGDAAPTEPRARDSHRLLTRRIERSPVGRRVPVRPVR